MTTSFQRQEKGQKQIAPRLSGVILHLAMPSPQDFLSAQQLQMFVASLSGLSTDEVRKAKSLYLRNAISEYRAAKAGMEGFGVAQGCFALIPIFWPILWAQRVGMNSGLKLYEERINNALIVWKDDLGDDLAEIQQLLAAV